ncbi:tRNA preQ1(34) S-adenosylmethionine ribosyltransferase-isomerase QueA [Aliikangiella coralliicola]|uniref:S-adenosylmethionine:tRNA ribosyltransferase-isomerase n=1 Tax=Aliikangiella coralliicola TaxID=2592383 RepID=A0A545UAF2_9GAMM|nr:tRNA preQ1(34) S-adenosylmethionine ribosyltransferase-isomerase QueA [Aliikangiella coralliicola]TQV86393.1 tRNA preQ1(34) S-adenosylmethionine ribosyltransferase-isomerase QueA [Aliikangiella coralliicola]
MRKQDFQFQLPDSLIANQPSENRTDSRLMVIDPKTQTVGDHHFFNLVDFLQPNDCLIFNNTKVIPARLQGSRETGGKVEVLIERIIPRRYESVKKDAHIPGQDDLSNKDVCIAQLRASNAPKPGAEIILADDFRLVVVGREGAFFKLESQTDEPLLELVERYGSTPLPPYIRRETEALDKQRYQTVYAEKQGAVAAPTAGLHFDEALLKKINDKGVETDFVTLHVGAGTFSPIRVDNILEHQMHSEWFEVPESVVELVSRTRRNGGRVIAVGTTSVRCLESASQKGQLESCCGETDIFIYPGYQFKSVDALVTNFHLSESTLLMLVSAFAGREFILDAYNKAVERAYRFFSYGDAMFIQNTEDSEKETK